MKCDNVLSTFEPQSNLDIPPTVSFGQRLRVEMGKIKAVIVNLALPNTDPKVFERHDRQGNLYYQVYDPLTRQSASFGSESEIRYWLEQRYAR